MPRCLLLLGMLLNDFIKKHESGLSKRALAEEYFEFGLFISRREYKTINRRLQRGRVASVMEGKFVGNKRHYGYDSIKLVKEKGFTLVPNLDEVPIVHQIFDWFTEGIKAPSGDRRRLGASLSETSG